MSADEPTYGPLTVDMVARFLWRAGKRQMFHYHSEIPEYDQARSVIDLLNYVAEARDGRVSPGIDWPAALDALCDKRAFAPPKPTGGVPVLDVMRRPVT